ncbi:PepSY domain-containing protein [Streptomyces sp. ISL-100]|uniref:PepSY domain-containing protein n=1 Tax=Streptomyces sp. ISL-100 TaxID=2819173 RepID=UPI001BEB209E|nr:PepSY domain-containing protein [Streptomyces sp. ISL-100]MBT2396764.1 PepSY domain-containing protein [Streptomyces sp. ISL-100]
MNLQPIPVYRASTPRARRVRTAGVLYVAAAAAAAALLSGCGNSGDDKTARAAAGQPEVRQTPSPSPTGSARLTEDQAARKALVTTAKVTADKAAATAVGEVSGSTLLSIELKRSPRGASPTASPTGSPSPSPSPTGSPSPGARGAVWVAEVSEKDGTEHTVRIDAASGDVIRARTDAGQDADDKAERAEWLTKIKQTPEQVAKAATDRKKGTVTSMELDDADSGDVIWSVEVVTTDDWNKTTYDIDATTGEVLSEDVDRD